MPDSPPFSQINIVALIIAFIGSFVSKEPLNVLQLLWVNLIMARLWASGLCGARTGGMAAGGTSAPLPRCTCLAQVGACCAGVACGAAALPASAAAGGA